MIEINDKKDLQPVPYIVADNGQYVVVFVEPGTLYSTYIYKNERDAKICANEVMPLILEARDLGQITDDDISKEKFEVEPLVKEVKDQYGFTTVTTKYYKGETVVVIYNEAGEIVTPEHRQSIIDAIEEERRRQEEREAERLPAQVDYTATMTDTLLPEGE